MMAKWLKALMALVIALLMCGTLVLAEGTNDDGASDSSISDSGGESKSGYEEDKTDETCKHENTRTVTMYSATNPCTSLVTVKVVCQDCGEVLSVSYDAAPGHNLDYTKARNVVPTTCVADGRQDVYCTRCGQYISMTLSGIGEHDWGNWITVTAETCTQAGEYKRVCRLCAAIDVTIEPATGVHTFDLDAATTSVVVQANACLSDGYYEAVCTQCGQQFTGENGQDATDGTQVLYVPLTHDWSAWYTLAQETCIENGEYTRSCNVCAMIDQKTVPATGMHRFDLTAKTTNVVVRANCETPGYYEAICTLCGQWFTGENKAYATDGTAALHIPERGHAYGDDYTITVTPTCLSDGERTFTCLNVDAAEDAQGRTIYTACGSFVEQVIPHDEVAFNPLVGDVIRKYHSLWRVVEVAATADDSGVCWYYCTRCDYRSEQVTYVDHLVGVVYDYYASVGQSVTFALQTDVQGLSASIICQGDETAYDWSDAEPRREFTITGDMFARPGDYEITLQDQDGCSVSVLYFAYDAVITLPAGLTAVEDGAFEGSHTGLVVVPEGVTSIGSRAFADCDGLLVLDVYAQNIAIADDAFEGTRGVIVTDETSTAYNYAINAGVEQGLDYMLRDWFSGN